MARPASRGVSSLLCGLVLLLILFPVLEDMARPMLLIPLVALVFVTGVIVVGAPQDRIRKATALAAAQVGLTTVAMLLRSNSFLYTVSAGAVLAVTGVLITYCIYCVLRYVLQAQYISRDQIYAGISLYLMLGFAFGCIYYLAGILDSGSFVLNAARQDGSGRLDLMYFSFITLATLGYGDITPVTRVARVATELEALSGTLYMAVFMARLVALAGGPAAPAALSNKGPNSAGDAETRIASEERYH